MLVSWVREIDSKMRLMIGTVSVLVLFLAACGGDDGNGGGDDGGDALVDEATCDVLDGETVAGGTYEVSTAEVDTESERVECGYSGTDVPFGIFLTVNADASEDVRRTFEGAVETDEVAEIEGLGELAGYRPSSLGLTVWLDDATRVEFSGNRAGQLTDEDEIGVVLEDAAGIAVPELEQRIGTG